MCQRECIFLTIIYNIAIEVAYRIVFDDTRLTHTWVTRETSVARMHGRHDGRSQPGLRAES